MAFSDVDYSGEDVISAVESAIASTLGIHSSDVEITSYDSATGVAAYSVGSDSVEAAQEIQSLLQTTDVSKSMENEISTTIPGIKSVNTTFLRIKSMLHGMMKLPVYFGSLLKICFGRTPQYPRNGMPTMFCDL